MGNYSNINLMFQCTFENEALINAFVLTKVALVFPLSVIVLCLGFRRWNRQRSFDSISHSDIFAYNAAAVELLFVMASVFYFHGYYGNSPEIMKVCVCVSAVAFPGEASLHVLTCLERYLAVVHPVTYMGLRHSAGARVRNIGIGLVWLLCSGWIGLIEHSYPEIPHLAYICLLSISLLIISFCSISVLRVLIHPGPGDHPDKSKKKAFFTITLILGVLVLFCVAEIISISVINSGLLQEKVRCELLICSQWFSIPCGVVLPLLFVCKERTTLLHKKHKPRKATTGIN